MALQVALENLLQQAGYNRSRAVRLAEWIDQAAIPGMSADDLFSAFMQWRRRSMVTEGKLKKMGGIDQTTNDAIFDIATAAENILLQRLKYQPVFEFAKAEEAKKTSSLQNPS